MKRFLALVMMLLLAVSVVACTPEDSVKDKDKTIKADYFIEYGGVKIEVGADAKTLMPKLGNYKSEDGEACGTGEKDVIYTLSGIEIETHVSGENEKVRQIKILDDTITTFEGAAIGDSKEKVINLYGDDYDEGSNGAVRYAGVNTYIEFHFNSSGNTSNIYIKAR